MIQTTADGSVGRRWHHYLEQRRATARCFASPGTAHGAPAAAELPVPPPRAPTAAPPRSQEFLLNCLSALNGTHLTVTYTE